MIESKYRLCYLVSHPIQYQAPLLRRIAEMPDIELTVVFETLFTASAYHDDGFGCVVEWDSPLTNGYTYQIASRKEDIELSANPDHYPNTMPLKGCIGIMI